MQIDYRRAVVRSWSPVSDSLLRQLACQRIWQPRATTQPGKVCEGLYQYTPEVRFKLPISKGHASRPNAGLGPRAHHPPSTAHRPTVSGTTPNAVGSGAPRDLDLTTPDASPGNLRIMLRHSSCQARPRSSPGALGLGCPRGNKVAFVRFRRCGRLPRQSHLLLNATKVASEIHYEARGLGPAP